MIEQALAAAAQRQLEQQAAMATPVTALGMLVGSAVGAKNIDAAWFNPFERAIYVQDAVTICNPDDAKLFLDLTHSGKVPSWTLKYVDIDLIRASANGN